MKGFIRILLPVALGIFISVCSGQTGEEPVRISAARVSGDAEKKITYLEGNVRIVQGKTIITTESVTINLDHKTAVLDKGTRLKNSDVTIDSRRLDYNLKQKTGTFREKVILRRLESGDTAKKDPFSLDAHELYFETETQNFVATGNCRLKHKQFEGMAERIEYDDAGQKLTFQGSVEIRQDQTVIHSGSVVVDMSQKQLQLQSQVDLTSREMKINAKGLIFNYEQKTGNFSNDVILSRPEIKNAKGKIVKEPFTLKASGLYFETESNNFKAEAGRIEHQEFTGTADTIEYDDKRQLVTFKGNARLTRDKGETLNSEFIDINLHEQNFTVHQKGTVILKIQEEQ